MNPRGRFLLRKLGSDRLIRLGRTRHGRTSHVFYGSAESTDSHQRCALGERRWILAHENLTVVHYRKVRQMPIPKVD